MDKIRSLILYGDYEERGTVVVILNNEGDNRNKLSKRIKKQMLVTIT